MTNILHTIETGGPGGAENFMIRLAEKWREQGWNNSVYLLKEGWLSQQFRDKGIKVYVHQGSQDIISICKQLLKVIKNDAIDIVHSHEFLMNVCVGLVSPLSRVKSVVTVHGKSYYVDKLQRRILYRIIANTSEIVAVSEDIKKQLHDVVGIPDNKIHCIANGIDIESYQPDDQLRSTFRKQLDVKYDETMILAVGNLYPVKGHKYLLEAASVLLKKSRKIKVFIAGRGQCQDELQNFITEQSMVGKVDLLGFRSDVTGLLQACDIFCMPSLSEGMPLSILEAMSAMKPVVATDVGGVSEVVIDGKTGLLVQAEDSGSLAAALDKFIVDKRRMLSLGLAGNQEVIKQFSLQDMLDSYKAIYQL